MDEDTEKNLTSTQQSSVHNITMADMDTEGEELLDYEEEPVNTEVVAMANLEKSIEERAAKLLKEQAINIPSSGVTNSPTAGQNSSSKNGEDSDEIDWDKVGSNLWSDEEGEFTAVKERNTANGELRRSLRIQGDNIKIQEKAEAAKKKANEFAGNSSSFAILNSIDPHVLESVALATNISLGNNEIAVAATISTIQANENARAALHEAKKKIAEQDKKENIEGGTRLQESLSEHDSDRTGFEVDDAGTTRPPKKPPRLCSNSQTNRAGCNRNRKRK
jgi:hypothetical protein